MKKLLRNLLLPTLFTSIFSGYGKIMMAVLIISLPLIFAGNVKGLRLDVYNRSTGVSYSHMIIVHISGATEGNDGNYDGRYLESPWLFSIIIYSHNYVSGLDYFVDARDLNSTTTYDLHLKNTGFSGTADNMLTFVMKDDSNFTWKNIFLGDANDSNDIVADIKYIIYNGSVLPPPYNSSYGDFHLPDVDGSNVGVYDKRKVFFFNYADLNRDRRVDARDYAIWARNFGRSEESDPNTLGSNVGKDPNDLAAYSDIDRNGRVDYNDLSLFSGEWLWDANDPNTWSRVR
jgi:hypothetical protein